MLHPYFCGPFLLLFTVTMTADSIKMTAKVPSMTTPSSVARLLNLNLRNVDDGENLLDVINDYFTERTYNDDDSDISDTEGEESDMEEKDECNFSAFTNIPDLVLPTRKEHQALSLNTPDVQTQEDITPLCSCALNDGRPCYIDFDRAFLDDTRMQYQAMTHSEHDLGILCKIESGIHTGESTRRKKHKEQTLRKRTRNKYSFHGQQICRKVFQYLHCVGEKQLTKLTKQLKNVGVEARIHGRTKKMPANALSYEDNCRIVEFVSNYADIHAITLPGRTPHHWVTDARLLPTNCTKKKVYELYREAVGTTGFRVAAQRTFLRLWKNLMPFISTMKPASDLCFTCQKGVVKVNRAANLDPEVKSEAYKEMENHLFIVTRERSFLRSIIDAAKRELPLDMQLEKHNSCTFSGLSHYSFDFAQQVMYPCNPLQPGPIYFKAPRKCGLFGVHCEALSRQVNFLIDEAVNTGKGANCIISLIHFFFDNYGLGEEHLHLHADNCSGQNKNSAMLWYLLWRTMTGRHNSIKLSFLITGHTKFSPDGAFGLIKRKFRRTPVNCLADIADVVTSSSAMNLVQLCGNEAGDVYVPTYDWTSHLAQFFKKLVGIKQHQHFEFFADGTVCTKLFSDSDAIPHKLLKAQVNLQLLDGLPNIVRPEGLDIVRQRYLYKEIREFVDDPFKDIVAPMPQTQTATASTSIEPDIESEDEPIAKVPKKIQGKGKGKKTRGGKEKK